MKISSCICGKCERKIYIVDDKAMHEVKIIIDNPELNCNESVLLNKKEAISLINELSTAFGFRIELVEET